ncbi:RNI-like protein, partial [Neocallimastix lanati (nom. inval.)]
MNIKNLLKGLNLALLASIAFASDCDEIQKYLQERKIDYNYNIRKCVCTKDGKLDTIKITNENLEEKDLNKILSYNTIKNLDYYHGLYCENCDDDVEFSKYDKVPKAITKLPKLETLSLSYNGYREYARDTIGKDVLKLSNTVKSLTLAGVEINEDNVNEISKLTNLETLNIISSVRARKDMEFDALKSLTKLTTLEITDFHHFELENIPNFIYSLTNLKSLTIKGQNIKTIPDKLSTLKNLTYLDLSGNQIDSELPESLNNLSKLEHINLQENVNIKGKTLTNSSLKKCIYESKYSLCKAKDMNCFENNVTFEACKSDKTNVISSDGRCGKDYGSCPSGQCCSKYGWCGTDDKYCLAAKGCNPEFGKCKDAYPVSTDGKCGKDSGRCPSDKCCSKYGYCGTSDKYCSIDKGCQSLFGRCTSSTKTEMKTSTNGKCGKEDGKCPSGQCCSKYGWCGTSSKHCGEGCLSEFGNC